MMEQIKIIPFFKTLTASKLDKIVSKIKVEHFNDGEKIISQGEDGNKLYIVKHGRVDLYKDHKFIKTLEENSYFGERALFFKEPRTATIKAKGFVELLSLEDEEFKILLETNLKEFLINRLILQDVNVALTDLDFIKEISVSDYAKIYLVKNLKTKYLYALKQIPKEAIYYEQLINSIETESKEIKKLDHPFILNFIKISRDSQNVYFLLEYIKGKNLDNVLSDIGLLTKNQTQFYTACLLVVIDYLHSKCIIYRDVRPSNVMVGENGYIKLIDYGSIKVISDKTFSLVGTPYYMSPEIILGDGYSFEYDFWSIACCAYEFHCGTVPFGDSAEEPIQIYTAIINQ